MKNLVLTVFLVITCCGSTFAFNSSFLEYSPVFYFTEHDTKIMNEAMARALNQGGNQKVSWKNPNTGANGYIIPSNRTTKNNLICRNLQIFNEANNVTGRSSFQFCRMGGQWKLVH